MSVWDGPDEDAEYMVQAQLNIIAEQGDVGVVDIIAHMNEMQLTHTRSNFDLLLTSL